jgi:hypothetical protein
VGCGEGGHPRLPRVHQGPLQTVLGACTQEIALSTRQRSVACPGPGPD